jgi:ribonuclease BN (tRNA processing enzyme)
VLIHEGHSPAWIATRPETFQRFSEKYHTTTPQLAELARAARPKLLVLYHYVAITPEDLFREIQGGYPGHFVVGRDLDVY